MLTHKPTCQKLTDGRVDYRNEGYAKQRMKQQIGGHIIPRHLKDLAIVVMCNIYTRKYTTDRVIGHVDYCSTLHIEPEKVYGE